MVTASHNPAQGQRLQVYLGGRAAASDGNGVQIVPPVDKEIAARSRPPLRPTRSRWPMGGT